MKKLFTILLLVTSVAFADHYPVARVVDGDTVRVTLPNGEESVRLLGIDAPETVHPRRDVEPYGPEAAAYARELMDGELVALEYDVQMRDQYGRLLSHVFLEDGGHVNLLIAQAGLATTLTQPPNVLYADVLRAAVEGARSVKKGMWADLEDPFDDHNCSDFMTQDQAQAFYVAAQPGDASPTLRDPHRLDSNRDGIACASLTHGGSRR